MPPRIAIGQLWQETNTLNPLRTTRQDFLTLGLYRGPELIEKMAQTNELGGFIQSLRRWKETPEIVPLVRLPAWPSGTATAETFAWLLEEMTVAVRAAGPIDAVLLALHGAMVAEQHPDVEGEFLAAIRAIVGPHTPIVATLDLHANVTERMVAMADALVLFHTAPHIDVFETGERAAALLHRILFAGARPTMACVKIPLVVPAERANTQNPASVSFGFRERLEALEKQPGILTAGLAVVQPWLDIPELGSAVLVVTDNDAARAVEHCRALADDLWQARREYLPELTPLEAAVAAAYTRSGLTVLSDSADATTSGAPGDSTHCLREMLRYDWQRPALVTLVAPGIVEQATKLGVGATFTATLGGVRDHRFSTPVTTEVTVERLFDAQFTVTGHLGRNLFMDMGRSVVLRRGNLHIVVTSRTGAHFAPELFRAAGIDPFAAQLLIAKSPCGFRAVYEKHAAAIQVVRAPGCAPSDFWKYDFRQIPRPLWPWDDDLQWQAGQPWLRGSGQRK